MMARLGQARLADLPPQVARPTYDRSRSDHTLVHLGPGAFHRAHQAMFTEDARLAGGGGWSIVGVSLRHGEVQAALRPQDGLYSVEFLAEPPSLRVVGVITDVLTAPAEPERALAALAAPATSVVTLTVTEAGYCLDGEGRLDLSHPDIRADLAGRSTSAPGWIVRGLAERRRANAGPLTVISCDNLLGNGRRLEDAVMALADRVDTTLPRWIAANATFPATMVDCIVPASDPAQRARAAASMGMADLASVQREKFAQWVIEDRFAGPRPGWELAGVEIVTDVAGYERLKLHAFNLIHSALAYLGLPRGLEYVRQAIADPALAVFADALVAEEVAPALPDLPVASYWRGVRQRLANPRLDHRRAQIGQDGSVKLAQRAFPLLIAAARANRTAPRLAATVRAWLDCARRGLVADAKGERLAASGYGLAAALDDPRLFPEPFQRDPAVRALVLDPVG